ncbi:hypothetical protein QVD99_004682 [Batrachochytrium dendrobatidis]|nr:hypothetical protein QVD99_004682 [Batrachochytrium dendrobatidis]
MGAAGSKDAFTKEDDKDNVNSQGVSGNSSATSMRKPDSNSLLCQTQLNGHLEFNGISSDHLQSGLKPTDGKPHLTKSSEPINTTNSSEGFESESSNPPIYGQDPSRSILYRRTRNSFTSFLKMLEFSSSLPLSKSSSHSNIASSSNGSGSQNRHSMHQSQQSSYNQSQSFHRRQSSTPPNSKYRPALMTFEAEHAAFISSPLQHSELPGQEKNKIIKQRESTSVFLTSCSGLLSDVPALQSMSESKLTPSLAQRRSQIVSAIPEIIYPDDNDALVDLNASHSGKSIDDYPDAIPQLAGSNSILLGDECDVVTAKSPSSVQSNQLSNQNLQSNSDTTSNTHNTTQPLVDSQSVQDSVHDKQALLVYGTESNEDATTLLHTQPHQQDKDNSINSGKLLEDASVKNTVTTDALDSSARLSGEIAPKPIVNEIYSQPVARILNNDLDQVVSGSMSQPNLSLQSRHQTLAYRRSLVANTVNVQSFSADCLLPNSSSTGRSPSIAERRASSPRYMLNKGLSPGRLSISAEPSGDSLDLQSNLAPTIPESVVEESQESSTQPPMSSAFKQLAPLQTSHSAPLTVVPNLQPPKLNIKSVHNNRHVRTHSNSNSRNTHNPATATTATASSTCTAILHTPESSPMSATSRLQAVTLAQLTTILEKACYLPGYLLSILSCGSPSNIRRSLKRVYKTIQEMEDRRLTLHHKLDPSMVQPDSDSVDRMVFTTASATSRANIRFNRYTDILPFDYNRVRLQGVQPNVHVDGESSTSSLHIRSPVSATMLAAGTDYINASAVYSIDGHRKYIAAQGPMPTTLGAFWEMIWEQSSGVIVMLTQEEEAGRIKCTRYWPDVVGASKRYATTSSSSCGPAAICFRVQFTDEVVLMNGQAVQREFIVKKEMVDDVLNRHVEDDHHFYESRGGASSAQAAEIVSTDNSPSITTEHHAKTGTPTSACRSDHNHRIHAGPEIRRIRMLHFLAWPDHQVSSPCSVLQLIRIANTTQAIAASDMIILDASGVQPSSPATVGPMVVHCSAGCGRTGVFCTIDSVLSNMIGSQIIAEQYPILTQHSMHTSESISTLPWVDPSEIQRLPKDDMVAMTVNHIRRQRIKAVQTSAQFIFCYDAVVTQIGEWFEAGVKPTWQVGHDKISTPIVDAPDTTVPSASTEACSSAHPADEASRNTTSESDAVTDVR